MKHETIESVFVEEIKDLYDAEKQLVKALPKIAKAATSMELRDAVEEHLEATKAHVGRLEQVFQMIDMKPKSKPCEAMVGLVGEGEEAIGQEGDGVLRDVAIIGAAKRVEHYEMGAYQTAILLADALGKDSASSLLRQTLEEEEEADGKLESLCKEFLENFAANPEAEGNGEDEEVVAAAPRGNHRRASK